MTLPTQAEQEYEQRAKKGRSLRFPRTPTISAATSVSSVMTLIGLNPVLFLTPATFATGTDHIKPEVSLDNSVWSALYDKDGVTDKYDVSTTVQRHIKMEPVDQLGYFYLRFVTMMASGNTTQAQAEVKTFTLIGRAFV